MLPHEDFIATMEENAYVLLHAHGLQRYEISAFARAEKACQHNLNYWHFGDYFGIGAGSHGKLTMPSTNQVIRTKKHSMPKSYLDPALAFLVEENTLSPEEKKFEFILNTTRLEEPIPFTLFTKTTGLEPYHLHPWIEAATEKNFILVQDDHWQVTALGRRFTNDLQALALVTVKTTQ